MDSPKKPSAHKTAFIPFAGGAFCFDCHRELSCFNECCAKLRLILTPYDIVRIKNRLDITSGQFLDEYTKMLVSDQNRFPMVRLAMRHGEEEVCPFVTPEGCAIYEDRPVACRMYPLGRASRRVGSGEPGSENFFVVKEPHCRGFQEERWWDLVAWLRDQGVEKYDAANQPWTEIVTSSAPLQNTAKREAQLQVFYTVSYDVDKFRRLAFEGGFFDRFPVDSAQRNRMKSDDVALLAFGFTWLRFSLFGERAPGMPPPVPPSR